MKWIAVPVLMLASIVGVAQSQDAANQNPTPENLVNQGEPPILGIYWTRDFQAARPLQTSSSPLMTYHGGNIMPTAATKAIFWGTSWGSYSGDKIVGLDNWYIGFEGSRYAKTSDEYTGLNGRVGPNTTYGGHVIDTSPASGGGSGGAVLAEVCKIIVHPDALGNGYYAVYTDLPRGNANYCAWHSAGTCGGKRVQFAFFWKLDGDSGCDPMDTSGLHSEGLAALANVSGHELSEARTDPATPGAWFDSSGAENGDKCAWAFGTPLVTFFNGSKWKMQGEWSNAAYKANTGFANHLGQKGCLSGK